MVYTKPNDLNCVNRDSENVLFTYHMTFYLKIGEVRGRKVQFINTHQLQYQHTQD